MGEMEEKYKCLRQVSRPSSPIPLFLQEANNMGDCYSCKLNAEENKNCALYYPIKITNFKENNLEVVKESELEKELVI